MAVMKERWGWCCGVSSYGVIFLNKVTCKGICMDGAVDEDTYVTDKLQLRTLCPYENNRLWWFFFCQLVLSCSAFFRIGFHKGSGHSSAIKKGARTIYFGSKENGIEFHSFTLYWTCFRVHEKNILNKMAASGPIFGITFFEGPLWVMMVPGTRAIWNQIINEILIYI